MRRNIYRNIKDFGRNNHDLGVENPLSYCMFSTIDKDFLHGGNAYVYGPESRPCQSFMSKYCSEGWDGFCEVASKNTNASFPNQLSSGNVTNMNNGETLIRNTAQKKYLVAMEGNCVQKFEPFDPLVANSPMISYWGSGDCYSGDCAIDGCIPYYAVNAAIIDDDPVMNKILNKPSIAFDILMNIHDTMKKYGTYDSLKGTKLGKFYDLFFEKMKKECYH